MTTQKMPDNSKELVDRIRLVRRDMGDLLFHFTRGTGPASSASKVLNSILERGELLGTSHWTQDEKCVCFTEAPIAEFNSVFNLVEIAASKNERPRYEPYGIAVSKSWLFSKGGRPVIYDDPATVSNLPLEIKYRFVPYDPVHGTDYTWEREWRIKADALSLDPKHTLVVVPTADEAFQIVYDFASEEAEWDVEGTSGDGWVSGTYHEPRWLAVSLDIFGFARQQNNAWKP